MVRALKMQHDEDPAEVLLEQVKPYVSDIDVAAYHVLVAVYVRPEKTAGGILLPGNAGPRKEDVWQGKVGLIVKVGPHCFEDSTETKESERFATTPKVGDWVVYNIGDTFAFQLGHGEGTRCRLVYQEDIKLVTRNPDAIY